MPSESKVPVAAVESGSGSGDDLEEVTIDVQQMDGAQRQMNHPTSVSVMQMEQTEQEIQQQSVTINEEQQESHRKTAMTKSPVAQSSNNEPSTPQKAAQSRSTSSYYAQHHSPLTKVNGKGLWRSWKRNFQSKLLALMDLIDNSLDAAVMDTDSGGGGSSTKNNSDTRSSQKKDGFIGRVHVYPDVLHESPTSTTPSPSSNSTTTGIILINNSHTSIRPLQQILEVYNSSKTHSGSSHIGENGVGLKQGAATLSDLTFVLVKKRSRDDGDGEGVIELGLIAESLQREEGCCLPAFTFPISNDGGKQDITNLLLSSNNNPTQQAEIATCITQYGHGSLERGIHRLSQHFHEMCYGDTFGTDDNVFCLILDRVDYGHTPTTESKCFELLKDLRMEIPRFYLHMSQTFDFRIGRGAVSFDYWPQRLVEMSSISVLMNHTSHWYEYKSDADAGAYNLRVLVGFDRYRINDKSLGKEGSLYIYSRKSGRLIKCMPDGRGYLGLQNTGSMYCQGLTIIIDDIGGHLPLNPTKQAIAFAEQTNGKIHEENLIAHIGVLAKTYYKHHLDKYNNRTTLTKMIKDFGNDRVEVNDLKDIDSSELTTFKYSTAAFVVDGKKKIRIDPKVPLIDVTAGRDTRFSLVPPRKPSTPPPPVQRGRPRGDQNESRKRSAREITTGRERLIRSIAPLAHDARERSQLTARRRIEPSSIATVRGKTMNHLITLQQKNPHYQQPHPHMQQNTLQHQQQRPFIHQPVIQQQLPHQLPTGQSQPPSNAFDPPRPSSTEDNYKVLFQMHNSLLKEMEAKIKELETKDAKIQQLQTVTEELQTANEQMKDDLRKKDEKVQRLQEETRYLQLQMVEIVQNRAEIETSEMI